MYIHVQVLGRYMILFLLGKYLNHMIGIWSTFQKLLNCLSELLYIHTNSV